MSVPSAPRPKPVWSWEAERARRAFDPNRKVEKVRGIYQLAGKTISTPGNLTTLFAAPKVGKTAALSGMLASVMLPEMEQGDTRQFDTLGFWSSNPQGKVLLHFDSEQSADDHFLFVRRVLKRAMLIESPPWFISHWLLGLSAKQIWTAIVEETKRRAEEFGGVHSIIIDGLADAVNSVNNEEDSNAIVAAEFSLADKYDCPGINVLHFNPGGEKGRGHLGSQLERKSETNLRLDKDDDGITEMWSEKQRRAPIPKGTGPCFQWSNEHDMHVSVQNPAEAKAEAKAEVRLDEDRASTKSIFDRLGKSSLRRKDIIDEICKVGGHSESTGKRVFNRWVETKLIQKEETGNYLLTV